VRSRAERAAWWGLGLGSLGAAAVMTIVGRFPSPRPGWLTGLAVAGGVLIYAGGGLFLYGLVSGLAAALRRPAARVTRRGRGGGGFYVDAGGGYEADGASPDCGSDCDCSEVAGDGDGSYGSTDCTASDCASSDCASSDCAPSDCAPSDCAPSDCAPSDCAPSDCAPSDCS
jgi:hypothetical protein